MFLKNALKKNREKKKKFNNLLPPGVDPSAFRLQGEAQSIAPSTRCIGFMV